MSKYWLEDDKTHHVYPEWQKTRVSSSTCQFGHFSVNFWSFLHPFSCSACSPMKIILRPTHPKPMGMGANGRGRGRPMSDYIRIMLVCVSSLAAIWAQWMACNVVLWSLEMLNPCPSIWMIVHDLGIRIVCHEYVGNDIVWVV